MIIFFKSVFFLSGTIPLFLGLFIYLSKRREIANRTYLGLSLSCALWSIGFYALLSSKGYETAYFWRLLMDIGAVILPAFWMHFMYSILKLEVTKRREIYLYYIYGGLLALLNILDYFLPGAFISGLSQNGIFHYYPIAGFGYYFFLLFYVIVVPFSLYHLIKGYGTRTGLEAQQIKYLIIASFVGFVGGGTAFLLTFNIPIPPYGIVFFAFYPIIVAYSMNKYHLFNIKVVATELFISGLSIVVFVRAVIAENTQERVINAVLFVATTVVGIFLIRSVLREVEQREKIEILAKDLGETNDRQEKLIHFIGHEVKGYLTKGEGGFSEIRDGDLGPISDDVKKLADAAFIEMRKGVTAVGDILRAANLKKGTIAYKMELFDLRDLVEEISVKLKTDAEAKGLKFNLEIDASSQYKMNGDRAQFGEHVIRNLIDNSIKYTPSGSVTVSLKKEVGKTIFSVKDTGVGITEEDKAHLFTEGGRGKDSLKVNVHSTGYGLFIAKSITEAHGGKISAESEGPGKGSTFKIELTTV